jgi:type VI secretion system protein ImpI/type VI secretion system protein
MTGVKLEIALEEEIGEQAQLITGHKSRPVSVPNREAVAERSPFPAEAPLDAFFRGAGIEAPKIEGAAANRMLELIGEVTRALVAGLVDNMQLRAVQKAQIRQAAATSDAGDNQLDFSTDVQASLERLFAVGKARSASPVASVRAAYAELRGHQRALLAGNRRALNDYLNRLDPETIERSVTSGKRGSLLNAAHRFRFWDVYKDVFAILGDRPADELPEPYQIALAEAYAKLTSQAAEEPEAVIEQRAAG